MNENNEIPTADSAASPATATDVQGPEAGTDLRSRVQAVIDKAINPALAMHGGYVQLLEIKGTTVVVEMGGGCQGCAASQMTLQAGIETMIVEEVPEVTAVVDGTDHGAGANPYYGG